MRKLGTGVVAVVSWAAVLGASPAVVLADPTPVSFAPPALFATGTFPWGVTFGDLNGDSFLDLATASSDSDNISVLFGDGAGGFGPHVEVAAGDEPLGVAMGDLNNDTVLDLVAADFSGASVSVLLGDRAGGFGPHAEFAAGANPGTVALGDLNGDSSLDAVTANSDSANVSVLLGDGAGGLGPHVDFETGAAPTVVAVGDVNGDSALDLVTSNRDSNSVSVLLGDGSGGFGVHTDHSIGASATSVLLADVNGDSFLDMVAAAGYSSHVAVLLGDGTGGFAPRVEFATGLSPRFAEAGDVNGDTLVDLAVTNFDSSSVSVLLGDGVGGFSERTDYATSRPMGVGVADLNGDGRLDLTVANRNSSTASVFLNRGLASMPGPPAIGSVRAYDKRATVSWTAPSSDGGLAITGYVVTPHIDGVAQAPVAFGSTATTQTITGLANGTTYTFTAAAVNGVGTGPPSEESNPVTPQPATITVTPDASLVDGQVVDVASSGWEPGHQIGICQAVVAGPSGVENCDGAQYKLLTADAAGSITSPLTLHRTIYVPNLGRVVDCANPTEQCVVGAADSSDVAGTAVTTPLDFAAVAPGAPTILRNATASYESAMVSWTAPTSDGCSPITGYVVTPYIGYFPLPPVTFASTATTQTITGLTNGTEYRFRVQAVNAIGTSGYSKVTNPVTPAVSVPGAPTIIRNAAAGDGQATVSWTAPGSNGGSPITGYAVTPYIGYYPLPSVTFGSTATTQTVTGLTNGTEYRFRVQAVNAVGTSGYSKVTNPVTPMA